MALPGAPSPARRRFQAETLSILTPLLPSGESLPNASALSFRPGQVRAAATFSVLGLEGQLSVWNDSPGTLHLVLDVTGYFLE